MNLLHPTSIRANTRRFGMWRGHHTAPGKMLPPRHGTGRWIVRVLMLVAFALGTQALAQEQAQASQGEVVGAGHCRSLPLGGPGQVCSGVLAGRHGLRGGRPDPGDARKPDLRNRGRPEAGDHARTVQVSIRKVPLDLGFAKASGTCSQRLMPIALAGPPSSEDFHSMSSRDSSKFDSHVTTRSLSK